MNLDVTAYFNDAMDYIQHHSVHKERINWQALRQEISPLLIHAETPAETYPAIQAVLQRLEDRHSFFSDPVREQRIQEGSWKRGGLLVTYPEGIVGLVDSDSPAEKAEIHVGDHIETINGQSIATLTIEQFRTALGQESFDLMLRPGGQTESHLVHLQADLYSARHYPQGRQLENDIGYLDLPWCSGNPEHARSYAETAHAIIRELDRAPLRGWIIDLRRNRGGNVWPMIAGIGPLLGEGEYVSFVASWEKEIVCYRDGQAYSTQEGVITEVSRPYHLQSACPPIAVLVSQFTASAAELVVLAFHGRPHSRSFGEPTYGVPTGNSSKMLSDGAVVYLKTHLGADRLGQTYDGPLLPDDRVQIDWVRLGAEDDPVVQAAIRWIRVKDSRF